MQRCIAAFVDTIHFITYDGHHHQLMMYLTNEESDRRRLCQFISDKSGQNVTFNDLRFYFFDTEKKRIDIMPDYSLRQAFTSARVILNNTPWVKMFVYIDTSAYELPLNQFMAKITLKNE